MASTPPDFGTWEFVRDEPFVLDAALPAARYRWRAPESYGPFEVEFQSVEARPERRFYPVEALSGLAGGTTADRFVDRVCEFGLDVLPHLDAVVNGAVEGTAVTPADYQQVVEEGRFNHVPLLAVFRCRRVGHASVTRDFHRGDDFADTTASKYHPDSVVPGFELPRWRNGSRPTGTDLIDAIQAQFWPTAVTELVSSDAELRLDFSPLRTPLDHLLVHGIRRSSSAANQFSFERIVEQVAPALIDGLRVADDSDYLRQHRDDYRHFIRRVFTRVAKRPAGFQEWLRQEGEKGFVRLLPRFKGFDADARVDAGEKARRFYRRLLWTSYEAMSRAYGAVVLSMWLSFCEAEAVTPSAAEQLAFRWYTGPLACTAGMPLWFFGTNVLRWVLGPFTAAVWGLRPDAHFDGLTRLVGMYGEAAARRRAIDARVKQSSRSRKPKGGDNCHTSEQYREAADGHRERCVVPTVGPATPEEDVLALPRLPDPPLCNCGGRFHLIHDRSSDQLVNPSYRDGWCSVSTECNTCGREQEYRFRCAE